MTKHLPEARRRSQILEAARKLFVENGYVATKMSDIADTAGLSKGGVYFHFSSKEDVFAALVDDEFSRSIGFIQEMGKKDPSSEMFETLGKHFYERFYGESDAARLFVVMGEMALRDRALRKKLADIQNAYYTAVSELIQRGVQTGMLREDLDARAAAVILKAIMDGVEATAALDVGQQLRDIPFHKLIDVVMLGILKR